jgi:hypothetical protein
MAEKLRFRNVQWRQGQLAEIQGCPLGKTVIEHIGCPFFGGMRDKERREQYVPQQHLGGGVVKRITNVGCRYPVKEARPVDEGKSEAVRPPQIITDDFGTPISVDGKPVEEVPAEVPEGVPQPGDGKSQEVKPPQILTDDVGNPIDAAAVPEEEYEGAKGPLTCNCGPNEYCNVCRGKMGKPEGEGHHSPKGPPEPERPEIVPDPDGLAEKGEDLAEKMMTPKQKTLERQIKKTKKRGRKKGKGKGKKKGKKAGGNETRTGDIPEAPGDQKQ